MLGDRIGRAKTMMMTILLYSLFTGLSALSVGVYDFALYRFLTGLGVGGEFAVGVALVAEVMPAKARPFTLGLLQALSAVGNISAAFINLGFGIAEEQGLVSSPWRIMFMIGAVPRFGHRDSCQTKGTRAMAESHSRRGCEKAAWVLR